MIQPFAIQSPTQIFFGRGELERIPDILGQEHLREGAILLLTDRGVSPFLICRYVVLDPLATLGLPPELTGSTGLDALCHLLECYISKKANPYSDLFALEGIRLIFASLKTAFDYGQDLEARSNMLLAAFYGGVCIASSSTTGVHALSYPLGGMYRIWHGVANAMLLAPVMEFNQDAIPDRLERAAKAAGIEGDGRGLVSAFIQALEDLTRYVGIPLRLSAFGIEKKDIPELTSRVMEVTRLLSNNPKPISREEAAAIYERIL